MDYKEEKGKLLIDSLKDWKKMNHATRYHAGIILIKALFGKTNKR